MSGPSAAACIAASGLPGAMARLDQADVDSASWPVTFHAAGAHGLFGLLLGASETGDVELAPVQRAELTAAHAHDMARALILERLLIRVVHLLEEAGVSTRVLKGSAVAHLDYASASLRPFSDVDLLVRGAEFETAERVLLDAGFVRPQPAVRRVIDRRYGKGATFVSPDGCEVDLHRTLVTGPFGLRVRLDELWAAPQTYRIGGTTLAALSVESRILHAALHAVLGGGPTRLICYRDLAEMLLFGDYDDAVLRELSASWQAEPVLSAAVRETWHELRLADVTAVSAWAVHHRPSPRDHELVEAQRRRRWTYASASLFTVRHMPRWRDRLAMATALAIPSQEFLRARGTGVPGHLLRGLRRAVRDQP